MVRQFNKNIDEQKVAAEFAIRRAKINRLAVIVGVIVGAAIILLYQGLASNAITMILLVVVFISAAYVNMKVWRCPLCNGHLGKLYLGLKEPKYCPNCGIKFIEERSMMAPDE